MANYEILKTAIQQVVKTNGNNEITGALLQQSLLAMINSLGVGFQYVGIATTSTNPGTPDAKVFYFAFANGVYPNFGGLSLKDEMAIFYYDTEWKKSTLDLVTSDALRNAIESIEPIIINGNVVNAPDEIDITSNEQNLLQFKNRSAVDGMGYVILRKNKTFAEQVTQANTIYEIRYDFDLNGQEVTILENCVLNFNGGSLANGAVIGTNTNIISKNSLIFKEIELSGVFGKAFPEWFNTSDDDYSDSIQKCINVFNYITFKPNKKYYIKKSINLNAFTKIDGNGSILIFSPLDDVNYLFRLGYKCDVKGLNIYTDKQRTIFYIDSKYLHDTYQTIKFLYPTADYYPSNVYVTECNIMLKYGVGYNSYDNACIYFNGNGTGFWGSSFSRINITGFWGTVLKIRAEKSFFTDLHFDNLHADQPYNFIVCDGGKNPDIIDGVEELFDNTTEFGRNTSIQAFFSNVSVQSQTHTKYIIGSINQTTSLHFNDCVFWDLTSVDLHNYIKLCFKESSSNIVTFNNTISYSQLNEFILNNKDYKDRILIDGELYTKTDIGEALWLPYTLFSNETVVNTVEFLKKLACGVYFNGNNLLGTKDGSSYFQDRTILIKRGATEYYSYLLAIEPDCKKYEAVISDKDNSINWVAVPSVHFASTEDDLNNWINTPGNGDTCISALLGRPTLFQKLNSFIAEIDNRSLLYRNTAGENEIMPIGGTIANIPDMSNADLTNWYAFGKYRYLSISNKRNILYTYNVESKQWQDPLGYSKDFRATGENFPKMVDGVRIGTVFFNTVTNRMAIVKDINYSENIEVWVDADGEASGIKRFGPFSSKPNPYNAGFQYFNTDTHRMITWDGVKWWNPDGTEATN